MTEFRPILHYSYAVLDGLWVLPRPVHGPARAKIEFEATFLTKINEF